MTLFFQFLAFLNDDTGKILKLVYESERGQREEEFYKRVYSEDKLSFMRDLVPRFFGIVDINFNSIERIFSVMI